MGLPTGESPISFSQIRTEFGTDGDNTNGPVRLGQYRNTDPSFSNKNVGSLTNLSLDSGIGFVPGAPGAINVDAFHGKKLNVIVDYYSGSTENRPNDARTKYQASSASGNRVVVGGYKDRVVDDSSGSKVIIHVNKTIGSATGSVNNCAVRTGTGWESGTSLSIVVGSSGAIYGAGGNGGAGGGKAGSTSSAESGSNGGDGTSALGISYNGTNVILASGAIISKGYGGGGGGGSANGIEEGGGEDNLFLEHVGSGGGGGAGLPVGEGGTVSPPDTSETATNHNTQGQAGNAGNDATTTLAGTGGAAGSDRNIGQGGYAGGGKGGDGGDAEQSAQDGNPGETQGGEWQNGPNAGGAGEAGGDGAAIRKASGVSWSFGTNLGTITGEGAGGSGESPTGVS